MIAAAASLRRLFSNHLSVPSSSRPYFHPVVNIHHRYTHAVSQPRHGNSETTKKIRQKRCDIGVGKFEKKLLDQISNAQYTPPKPTRLNCRVELRRRRRCVLNSQLAHDDCRRKFGNWTCWEFILSS